MKCMIHTFLFGGVLAQTSALILVNDSLHQHQNSDKYLQHGQIVSGKDILSPLSVLFESDRILAIEKPSGISHHDSTACESPHGGEKSQQQRLGILSHLRQLQSTGNLEYTGRLYGVHRLDQVTSGILLLAKDAQMASQLTRAFREGRVTKYYVGLSQRSSPPKKQGWIRGQMIRGRRKTWLLTPNNSNPNNSSSSSSSSSSSNDGNQPSSNMAITRFFTAGLGNLPSPTSSSSLGTTTTLATPRTCILFRPYTGRTHQLRVAAKAMGLALLGDPLYRDGSSSSSATHSYEDSSMRTCLHAAGIHVELDDDNHSPITIWSRPPFGDLFWNDTSVIETFDQVTMRLMDKHCDCQALRELLFSEY